MRFAVGVGVLLLRRIALAAPSMRFAPPLGVILIRPTALTASYILKVRRRSEQAACRMD